MIGKVELSGINTSSLKVLTEKEKNELLQKTKLGDIDAREKLIRQFEIGSECYSKIHEMAR